MTSRWWVVFCLVGIGLWIAITVVVAMNQEPGSDGTAVDRAFAAGGALFFGALFTVTAIMMRRSQTRASSGLYDRLAIEQVPRATVKRALRGVHTIGYVYLVFGVLVTFIPLAGIAISDDEMMSTLLWVTIGLVVLWAIYMVWALRRVFTTTDVLFRPLGLKLVGTPTYLMNLFTDGGQMVGAMTYAGERHGRAVTIAHGNREAVTFVAGPVANQTPPTTPVQMMKLTGEGPRCWKGAEVMINDEGVAVVRRGNESGRWFLQDLLLAETLADRA